MSNKQNLKSPMMGNSEGCSIEQIIGNNNDLTRILNDLKPEIPWDHGYTFHSPEETSFRKSQKTFSFKIEEILQGDLNAMKRGSRHPFIEKIWLNLAYQRRAWWDIYMRSDFVDSLMEGYLVQHIYVVDIVQTLQKDAANQFLTDYDRRKLWDALSRGQELMSFDGNNRCVTIKEYFNDGFKWYPKGKEYKDKYPNGAKFSELTPADQDRFCQRNMNFVVFSGHTMPEIHEQFMRFHASGAMSNADIRNAIQKLIRDFVSELANKEYDAWQAHINDGKPIPKGCRMFYANTAGDYPHLDKRANDEMIAKCFFVFADLIDHKKMISYKKPLENGKTKTLDRISTHDYLTYRYLNSDDTARLYWSKFEGVWSEFVKVWNARTYIDDPEKLQKIENADASDAFQLIARMYLSGSAMEIGCPKAFWELFDDMQVKFATVKPGNPYAIREKDINKWKQIKTKAEKNRLGLKNPKIYDWRSSRGSAWHVPSMNVRGEAMFKHVLDNQKVWRSNKKAFVFRRTGSSTEVDKLMLFNMGAHAPNVTEKDAQGKGKPLHTDHYKARKNGGSDDINNFWLVTKDDNESRQDRMSWEVYWAENYPGESLKEHLLENRLLYLKYDDLKASGKTCSICKEDKPWSDYQRDRSHRDGHKSSCGDCRNASKRKKRSNDQLALPLVEREVKKKEEEESL